MPSAQRRPASQRFCCGCWAATVKSDDFEPAYRVGKLLMEGKCNDRSLPCLAGIAAICVSDYPTAEEYLKSAGRRGPGENRRSPEIAGRRLREGSQRSGRSG